MAYQDEDDFYGPPLGRLTRQIDIDGMVGREATAVYGCTICGQLVYERQVHDEYHAQEAVTYNRALVAVDAEDADPRNPVSRVPNPGAANYEWAADRLGLTDG